MMLPTIPGTRIEFAARKRAHPCWRCRIRRLFGRRLHFNCQPAPKLTYIR